MVKPTCKTCAFYVPIDDSSGDCKRYPPVFVGTLGRFTNRPQHQAPNVLADDWCGEHSEGIDESSAVWPRDDDTPGLDT